jgi:hypothetical protein
VSTSNESQLDVLSKIHQTITTSEHQKFLNIDPQNLTYEEIGFDRSGRLMAWSRVDKAVATSLWMLAAARLVGGAMQANMSVANAYVADITPREGGRSASG